MFAWKKAIVRCVCMSKQTWRISPLSQKFVPIRPYSQDPFDRFMFRQNGTLSVYRISSWAMSISLPEKVRFTPTIFPVTVCQLVGLQPCSSMSTGCAVSLGAFACSDFSIQNLKTCSRARQKTRFKKAIFHIRLRSATESAHTEFRYRK